MHPERKRNVMIDSQLLSQKAYVDTSRLDRRKALYQFTEPHYNIEDVVLGLNNLPKAKNLLDVGCGTGKLLLKAAAEFPHLHLVGVDIADGMFRDAQKKADQDNLDIKFLTANVADLPFANHSFDRVTAMHMLYHSPDIMRSIQELSRVVKDDGTLLVTANSRTSRKQLGRLKADAARLMNREVFTDPNLRFNLEEGLDMLRKHFQFVKLLPYESKLTLSDPQPYVEYFDSLREFWDPRPNDDEWEEVMNHVAQQVSETIENQGTFSDATGFGVFLASNSPLETR